MTLYGRPLVKPANLESELEKIRSAAAVQDAAEEAAKTGAAAPRAKATLSNLILLNTSTSTKEVDTAVDQLIDKLCESYPSRFFVVDANLPQGSAPTGIATAVSSRCFLAESGAHVCSEEVYVSVEERAIPLVKNLLISLLAPDVDVVLVLLGDAAGSEYAGAVEKTLAAILPFADRIVYDSSGFRDYGRSLRLLTSAGDRGETLAKLADVNWRRTRQWRSIIAESFDGEWLAEASGRVSRLALTCERSASELQSGKLPPDALLIAGWTASSLERQLKAGSFTKSGTGVTFHCEGSGGSLQIDCLGTDSKSAAADILLRSVEMTADGASLRIERKSDRSAAEISIGGSTHYAPFLNRSIDELVLSQIMSRGADKQFLQALKLSIGLAESGQLN